MSAKMVVNLSIVVGDQVAKSTLVVDIAAAGAVNWTAQVLQLALNAATTPPPPDDQAGEWSKNPNTHAIYRVGDDAVGGAS